jgi:uncharacterized membrane protein (DUF373 family)
MDKFLNLFEKFVVIAVILLMVIIISVSIIVLGLKLFQFLASPSFSLENAPGLLDLLGYVLLILIGVELLETVKAFLYEHIVHVEIVLEVALIAVARKIILLDYSAYPPLTIFSIAALVLALSVGYYLEKRGRLLKKRSNLVAKFPGDTAS